MRSAKRLLLAVTATGLAMAAVIAQWQPSHFAAQSGQGGLHPLRRHQNPRPDRQQAHEVRTYGATATADAFNFAPPVLLTWPQSCATGGCEYLYKFYEVAVGDVTGDGLDDLVTANAGHLWI